MGLTRFVGLVEPVVFELKYACSLTVP
jgi:hypothetical protein